MANKQLKIWKEDFLRYYHKTSLVMRVAIGAVISFGIARVALDRVVKPQNGKVKALQQKIMKVETFDDVSLTIADIKNKQRKIEMQLTGLKRENERLSAVCGSMSRSETGRNMLDLRKLIDRHELRIVSEEPLRAKQMNSGRYRRGRSGGMKKNTHIETVMPPVMGCDSYVFQVLGSFYAIQHFLIQAFDCSSMFLLNNIRIEQSKEFITDRNFNQYQALSCSFEAHIPYKKAQK